MSAMRRWVPRGALPAGVLALIACVRAGESDSRYAAVHNALVATGLLQVGPMQRGSLREGQETRIPVELVPGECATIAALGEKGVGDLSLTLLDENGTLLSEDHTIDREAMLRFCPKESRTYTLVVKMAKGAGDFTTGVWAGAPSQGPAANDTLAEGSRANGSCHAPTRLAEGHVRGSTKRGDSEHEASCGNATGNEIVYRFDLDHRKLVHIELDARHDAVVYVRKGACAEDEGGTEVMCGDDSNTLRAAGLSQVLDAGTYYLFVDGYNGQEGSYSLEFSTKDVITPEQACAKATPLAIGVQSSGSLDPSMDAFSQRCDISLHGPDAVYSLDLAQKSRVRIRMHTTDPTRTVISVRKQCDAEGSEVGCSDMGVNATDTSYAGILPQGKYAVFGSAMLDTVASATFTIDAESVPEKGIAGLPGDSCANAIDIAPSSSVTTDTFAMGDDVASSCTTGLSPEALYHFNLKQRSRVTVRALTEEGEHSFAISKQCGDKASEIACQRELVQVLEPGNYTLAVEGPLAPQSGAGNGAGKVEFSFEIRDIVAMDAACKNPPSIVVGKKIKGSTKGAKDRFSVSCSVGGGNDRIYRLDVKKAGYLEATLTSSGWSGVLALRDACADDGTHVHEVSCGDSVVNQDSTVGQEVEAGTYYLVVKGASPGEEGNFELTTSLDSSPSRRSIP